MAAYFYSATDRQGSPQSGQIEAASIDEARGRLLERGWDLLSLSPVQSTVTVSPPALSTDEAEELVQQVARLAAAGFPLGSGFRAAADESDSERVAQALRMLAERIDQGQSLASILQGADNWLPPHVVGLILAALRTGRLGEALLELVAHQRGARSLRRGLWEALAYPLTVAILATVLLGLLTVWLSHTFEVLFRDFELQLPLATRHLFWWRDTGVWILLVAVLLATGLALVYRHRCGPAGWARLLASFPLFGPLLHFRGLAEWSSLMSVLIKNQVPLPDALRWSAEGVSNAWVAHNSRVWAKETASGQSVSDVLSSRSDFPRGLTPLIQWGEKNGVLAEAFATSREVLERRVRLRAEMLRSALPALLFLAIGCGVLMLVIGLFMPIPYLIQALS